MGLLGLAVNHVVQHLAGADPRIVERLGLDCGRIVDAGPADIRQHGRCGIFGPDREADRSGAAKLGRQNQAAQRNVQNAARLRQVRIVRLRVGFEVRTYHLLIRGLKTQLIAGRRTLRHCNPRRRARIPLLPRASRSTGYPRYSLGSGWTGYSLRPGWTGYSLGPGWACYSLGPGRTGYSLCPSRTSYPLRPGWAGYPLRPGWTGYSLRPSLTN